MTLERLVSTNGVACDMRIPGDVQTQNNLLRQLGQIYNGAFEAVKEYITNAADAGASEIEVRLKRKVPGNYSISVVDNGTGMRFHENEEQYIRSALGTRMQNIAPDSILRFPRSIGNSIRYGDSSTQGKKAIGALAWQVLADGIEVISKQDGVEPVGWTCDYESDNEGRPTYTAHIVTDGISRRTVPGKKGTVITLKKVSEDRMKELLPHKLQQRIGSMFRDLLKEGKRITIKDDKTGTNYNVTPEEYQGAPLINETISTIYGPIKVDIYINPNQSDSVVRVKQGIQTLVEDISKERTHLESKAWISGMLTGQVKADWLEPDASREGIQLDKKAKVFYEKLRGLNDTLETAVDEYKKSIDPIANRAMYGLMGRAMKKLVAENPDLAELFGGYRKSNSGTLQLGQPVDGFAIPVPGQHQPTPTTPTPTPTPGPGNGPKDPDAGKPIDPSLEGRTKGSKAITLRFDEEAMPPHILSRFEEEASVIVFNNAARAYIEASRQPDAKKMYLAALVGKELMSTAYKDPRELADQVVLFQQKFIKLLPTR
jgi:hypothetical protein